MMTEQQLQEMEARQHGWSADDVSALIAEVRRLQQENDVLRNTLRSDEDQFKQIVNQNAALRDAVILEHKQRDAALAERDEARERHETLSHHYRSLTASVSEAEQALEDTGMPEGQRFSVSVLAIVAQLTEARRVLREVLPVDCEHVHHPKRDQHPSDAACPVLQRAAAVLAQDTDA